jgi:hypothetical protein
MTKMTQKEGVFAAVMTVLEQAGIEFVEGMVVKSIFSKEHRAQVNAILFEGFKAGRIELDGEKSDSDLKSYVSGLQSNWLNKDKRLNGGVQYAAKNPGSRAGVTDPQVKALRGLLAQASTDEEREEIQGYLDARLEAIGQGKKKKTVQVNFDDLPPELKAKYAAE